jgi:hypothetical protein
VSWKRIRAYIMLVSAYGRSPPPTEYVAGSPDQRLPKTDAPGPQAGVRNSRYVVPAQERGKKKIRQDAKERAFCGRGFAGEVWGS